MGSTLRSLLILGCVGSLTVAAGCASPTPRVATVPDSAWDAAADSPRSSAPTTRLRTVRAARPAPSSGAPLTREQVVQLANGRDSQDAIAEIDRHPLAFPLDGSSLAYFEDRLVPPEVVDYLKKRAQVDWSQVRGEPPADSDPFAGPTAPPPPNDGWADAPVQDSAPSIVVEEPASPTVVYDSSPTIIVGASWYDGSYWRPWRPWYRSDRYVGSAAVYSSGYGGLYYSGRGSYGRGTYASGRANYGNYPYTQGSFVYAQPRGFVGTPAISRPPAQQSRGSFHSGGGTVRSGGPVRSGGSHHR